MFCYHRGINISERYKCVCTSQQLKIYQIKTELKMRNINGQSNNFIVGLSRATRQNIR